MLRDTINSSTSQPLRAVALEPSDEAAEEIRLDWRNLNAFVFAPDGDMPPPDGEEKQPAPRALWCRKPQATKQVLRASHGVAKPGEILAVMGPSGSGKTTLLNLLAGRPSLGDHGTWTGEVCINGQPPPAKWERCAGYSMQKDIFFEELTIEEHLSCTALLRLPAEWSRAAKLAEMARLVERLKLGGALQTRVGSATQRGLSGGELKRLNIVTELLCRPLLFFLDEPFTGLDSTMASRTLQTLRELASEDRRTVMLTVHQPSSAMWSAFDQLLLLAPGGYSTYHGPAGAAVAHMAALGHACPPLWNPPDFLIELVSPDEAAPDPAAFEARRAALAAAFAAAPWPPPPPPSRVAARPWAPASILVPPLTVRAWRRSLRAYLKPLEWALVLALAAVFGLLWWQVRAPREAWPPGVSPRRYERLSLLPDRRLAPRLLHGRAAPSSRRAPAAVCRPPLSHGLHAASPPPLGGAAGGGACRGEASGLRLDHLLLHRPVVVGAPLQHPQHLPLGARGPHARACLGRLPRRRLLRLTHPRRAAPLVRHPALLRPRHSALLHPRSLAAPPPPQPPPSSAPTPSRPTTPAGAP